MGWEDKDRVTGAQVHDLTEGTRGGRLDPQRTGGGWGERYVGLCRLCLGGFTPDMGHLTICAHLEVGSQQGF